MIYSLDLDITPNGVPQIVKLSQYDKTMPTLAITLYNGSQVFTIPTGCTAYIEGTKADKTGFQYPCTVSGGVINATITEQMTAFAGRVPCEIVLRKSGERKGSANFFLDIEPSALSDDTVISDSDLPIIQQMPEYAQSCADDAELAHKWATFGSDSETPSATNNAKYWAEQAEAVTGVGDLMTTRSKLGAKNLIPLSFETQTKNGVTITVQDDGSIVLNGTATGTEDTYCMLTQNGIPLESGECIMNGSIGGGVSSYLLFAATSRGTTLYCGEIGGQRFGVQSQNGDSQIFDINKMSTASASSYVDPSEINICLRIKNGYMCNNVVIKPMIRLATDHDSTYQPYAKSNRELTTDLSVTDITSQVTVHENLTADYFYVRQSGKVVMVLGTFTVTGDIPNGQALLSGLPNTGISASAVPLIMVPVRASMWSTTPSKYHFQGLSGNRITNATTTLKSGDVIQISHTYITTS